MKKKKIFLGIILLLSCFGFSQEQRVGVNTKTPEATLDVNGNMAIKAEKASDSKQQYDELYWDAKTKKIVFADDNLLNDSPFYAIKYRIKCYGTVGQPQNGDKVQDFDTKIDADKFLVIITFVNPVSDDYNEWLGVRHAESKDRYTQRFAGVDAYTTGSGSGSSYYNTEINPVREVNSFVKDNTWHFYINYPSARPPKDRGTDYVVTWEVSALVINKSLVKDQDYGTKEVKNAVGKLFDNPDELK